MDNMILIVQTVGGITTFFGLAIIFCYFNVDRWERKSMERHTKKQAIKQKYFKDRLVFEDWLKMSVYIDRELDVTKLTPNDIEYDIYNLTIDIGDIHISINPTSEYVPNYSMHVTGRGIDWSIESTDASRNDTIELFECSYSVGDQSPAP
jgi:hypothetical protein